MTLRVSVSVTRRIEFSLLSWRRMLKKQVFPERKLVVLRSLLCIPVEMLGRQLDVQVCILGKSLELQI